MRLICKTGGRSKKEVYVNPSDPLHKLLELLKVPKTTKFIFKGVTYSLACIFTFAEIEMCDNAEINIVTPSRAGFILNIL